MDRNLLEAQRAWEQTLTAMRREIADLRTRVGSSAIVVSSLETVDEDALGAPGTGAPSVILTVDAQPGRWYINSTAVFVGAATAGDTWWTSCRIFDRATGTNITPTDPLIGVMPLPQFKHPATSASVSVTLTSFGWISVEPSEYPDGFSVTLDARTNLSAAWPSIFNARLALLPF